MFWPFKRKPRLIGSRHTRSAIDASSDAPVPFGYKIAWWTVRSDDLRRVADFLGLNSASACNWSSGVPLAYDGGVFLTPPVNGWILICGARLPPKSEDAAIEVENRLEILSGEFSDAQVFATHRVVEYHVWARAREGSLTRGFGHLGEAGMTFWDTGFDESEDALGFDFVDFSNDLSEDELDAMDWPSEDHVMQVASAWSVSPVDFGEHMFAGVGIAADSAKFFSDTR